MTYLYHIREKGNTNLNEGYIGVCEDRSKRLYRHKNDPVNDKTKLMIESGIEWEFVTLIIASREYCHEIEAKLRPTYNIGWNVKPGGLVSNFPEETKEKFSKSKLGNKNVGSGVDHHFHGKVGELAVRFGTRGAKNPNHIGHWVTPLGEFESQSLAAEAHGISKSSVFYRCKQSEGFPDWYFKELENVIQDA